MQDIYTASKTTGNAHRSPIKELEDDVLPRDPIGVAINTPPTSIGALFVKLRTKAMTSSAAHEIVQDLVVTRMRAQAEVLKLNGELVSAAKKKDALNAYMAHGMDLSKKLSQRLIETMDILAALDWDSFDAAEAEAQMKTVEIERRKAAGEMNAAWAERALLRIEQVRDSKTAFANRIVGRFLEQLDEQVSMTLNTVQRDSDRYANFL